MANTGHIQRLWPVFVMLVAIVALPTAGVLWFMNQAMQNERLVVEQRLKDVYQSRLKVAAGRIQASWNEKSAHLLETGHKDSKTEAFAELVKTGQVDSALFYRNGRLVYPKAEANSDILKEPETQSWQDARNLEFTGNSPTAAAEIYEEIARRSAAVQESAMALMAEARCLNKAGQQAEAIDLLTRKLSAPRFLNAEDAQGRLIQPNALLFALQLMKDPSHPLFQKTAAVLVERLDDYRDPALRSTQRRFLMEQLQSLWPSCPQFPTLAAEELASEFERFASDRLKPGQMQPTQIADIWAYETQDESLVALFHQERLIKAVDSTLANQEPIQGVKLSMQFPGASDSSYLKEAIGDAFPSWRLALILEGPDPFQSATNQKITTYVWTGILMTAGIAMISILLAGYLQRQVRLTRLKNDLIATVSHELKTPLASMRLLVDTLRDGNYQNAQLTQEYLQMIAKENARLSSLIEGFLTFSRMSSTREKSRMPS